MKLKVYSYRPKDLGSLFVVGGPGGSGASTIAKMLANKFGLHYIYGGALMRQYAQNMGYLDLDKFLKSDQFDGDDDVIDQMIDEKLIRSSQWNNVLIDSKIFAALATNLQIPCTVKIWLDASLEKRVRRTLHKTKILDLKENLPLESKRFRNTAKELNDRYTLDKHRFKDMYGIDYDLPKKYNDIVIDSSPYGPGQTFNIILQEIKDGGYLTR